MYIEAALNMVSMEFIIICFLIRIKLNNEQALKLHNLLDSTISTSKINLISEYVTIYNFLVFICFDLNNCKVWLYSLSFL